MSTDIPVEKAAVNGIRTALGLSGAIALIVGILILVWPGRTAIVVTAIIAVYAVIGGLVYAGLGIFSTKVRAARQARNPRTGQAISVPSMRVPKFRPAKALKEAVK